MTTGASEPAGTRTEPAVDPVKIGIIGAGYWGGVLAREALREESVQLCAIADIQPSATRRLAGVLGRADVRSVKPAQILRDPEIVALVIATDATSHHEIALGALSEGKHVCIEKPFATSTADAMRIATAADESGLTALAGHTFAYCVGIERALYHAATSLGQLRHVVSNRMAYGRFRKDVDVLWNLAPHDVSILLRLAGRRPEAISCRAVSVDPRTGDKWDSAELTLDFESFRGHIFVSCVDPTRTRTLRIACADAGLLYDDQTMELVVRSADSGKKSTAETFADQLSPVRGQLRELASAISQQRVPRTPASEGVAVCSVLEAASQSASSNGAWVEPARLSESRC